MAEWVGRFSGPQNTGANDHKHQYKGRLSTLLTAPTTTTGFLKREILLKPYDLLTKWKGWDSHGV
jgi:hypothetical protein